LLLAVWQARSKRPSFWSSIFPPPFEGIGLGKNGLRHTPTINTRIGGEVNREMPVFSAEKNCIRSRFSFIGAGKYGIFRRKIPGFPHILYAEFLYDWDKAKIGQHQGRKR
jgi:hypothetical protein